MLKEMVLRQMSHDALIKNILEWIDTTGIQSEYLEKIKKNMEAGENTPAFELMVRLYSYNLLG